MANRHFGKFADVWKHLVLGEVLVATSPARYAETHAGSAAYPMVHDAERRFGVLALLEGLPSSSPLDGAAYPGVAGAFLDGEPSTYPGSALQAMTLLGDDCAYLLCDVDPVSAGDLRGWAGRLGLSRCEVAERDGMAAVRDRLRDPEATVVHIDPFDPFEREAGGPSAVELAAGVADAGHTLVYWYGVDNPEERAWAFDEIRSTTTAPLWCGDFLVTSRVTASGTDGNLGDGTTPGTGCGVVLANASPALVARCEDLAHALVDHYDGRELPNGEPGGLDLALHARPGRGQARTAPGSTTR